MRAPRMIAVLAMAMMSVSLLTAGAAGAKVFNAEVSPISFKGTGEALFSLEGTSMSCTSAEYSGEASSATKELEVGAVMTGCSAFGFASATVNFEGCKFRFDATTKDVDVVCPAGKVIKGVAGNCEVQIGPQEARESITYVNNSGPPKTVTAKPAVTGISFNKTKDGFLCPLAGTGVGTNGQYNGDVTISGSQGGKQTGIFVDPVGVFNAELSPAISILGKQEGEPFIFTIENGMGVECPKATYTGEVGKAVAELEVLPSYSECNLFGAAVTVNMEGCKYRFNANAEDVDLVCPVGKVVKVTVGTCEVQFGSQEGLKSVSYVNNAGPPKTVTVEAAVKGVKYNKTKDGALCPLAGTGEREDGEFAGDTNVKGFQGETQVGVFVN